ncbi:MAG TPA: DUF58 domain-containing protein [Povalibacter sp.]|uniref:DUF58 domain-containing protein n=1 Tax=Povalibacter sp. TaxID=1962978 RepID=UPI002B7BF23E|nr:DUF58 domain-containing protein [Povalibacter sp.]HMN46415.1 DUF58 domain-containing protein [Povalibacter sp.]
MSLRQNAFVLAVLTALVAIMGAWSGDATLAGLWRLPLGLLLLGLAYEGWMTTRAHLGLTIEPDQRGILGRGGSLQISVQHQLHRDALVELAPEAPALVEVDPTVQLLIAPAGAPAHTHLRITPRRLGEHAWPAIRTRIAGPLGLAWWPKRLATDFRLQVMPEVLRDDARRAGAVSSGAKPRQLAGTGSEVLQLRDYRAGDPQQLIDWKATARSGRLVSRDFSEDQHLEIVIAIDAGRTGALRAGDLDRFGHYANLAARFAEHAIAQDDRVGLVLFADRPLAALAPGRGTSAVVRIRRLLAASKPVQAESNPLNAALRIRSLVRHRSLVVLLTDLDDATVAGQLASAARLLLPKHLPLIAGLASPEAENMRHAVAHSWLDPYESLAAQEYCARLERNVLALRALGAPAVLARPDQLERAVFDAYAGFRQRRRV